MSTKTIFKRIALTAVSALAAGSLAVISVPVANAAVVANTVIESGNPNVAPSTSATNPTAIRAVLNIASLLSADGTTGTTTAAATTRSIGLLTTGDSAGTRIAGTTQTATLLSTGSLSVYSLGDGSTALMFTVSGGTITATNTNSGGANAFAADQTKAGFNTGANHRMVTIKPNAGATSMTVRLFGSDAGSITGAKLVNGDEVGTLTGQITVTVTPTSAAGTLSSARSGVFYADDTNNGTGRTSDSVTSGVGTKDWNTQQFLNVRVRDAYGNSVGTGGLLQATATNGALIKFAAEDGSATPTVSSDFLSSATDPDNYNVVIAAPSTSPLTTTVSVTWNGTLIGTKSFTFTGEVAKITLSAPKTGLVGNTSSGHNTATIVFQDSANNVVYITGNNTPSSGYAQDVTTLGVVSSISLSTAPANATTPGVITFGCGSVPGAASIAVTYTNLSGSIIKSNALPVQCSRIASRYTASYDKAVYAPGEIATLTVEFKDMSGNAAADSLTSAADNATHVVPVISVSGVTLVGAALAADDFRTQNGVLKYTFSVGNTEGTFTNSINFPQVNTNATSAGLTQTAVTATLTVKAPATGAITNAEVLSAIVKLIATINKQIRQLQKQLRR